MYKDFKSKFSQLVENVQDAINNDGFLVGMYVKIKKNALSNTHVKEKGETLKQRIQKIIDEDLLLVVTGVRTEYAAQAYGLTTGQESAGALRWITVGQEHAPGFVRDVLELPSTVLDIDLPKENNASPDQPESVKGKGSTDQHPPQEKLQVKDVAQTGAEDRMMPDKNVQIPVKSATPAKVNKPANKK